MAGEPNPVAAGSFNPGTLNGAEILSPTGKLLVALASRRHGELSQTSAQLVQNHRYVYVEVRIHTQDHLGRFCRAVAVTFATPLGVTVTLHPTTRRADDTVMSQIPLASSYEVTALRSFGWLGATPEGPVDGSLPRHLWLDFYTGQADPVTSPTTTYSVFTASTTPAGGTPRWGI